MTWAVRAETARDRARLYGLLAAVFRRPFDAAMIQGLREPAMLAALAAAGIDPGPGFAGTDEAVLRDALAIDFTHVFHNPEGKIMPYEGMMLGGEDELKGNRTEAVERFMAAVGYRVRPESGEMADHIATELGFMADLAGREADALVAGDAANAAQAHKIQADFLDRHLGRWAGLFSERVAARAQSDFYRAMAEAVSCFVTEDAAELTRGLAGAA